MRILNEYFMKTSSFVILVFIMFFPITLIADDNTITRNNLTYYISENHFSLVNASPEYDKKLEAFKLDNKCTLEEYKLLCETSRNLKGEVIELIKDIFSEEKLYNEDGKSVIRKVSYYLKLKTGETGLFFIFFNENVLPKNLDDNIHLFYNEFNKRIKFPPSNNESLIDSSTVILSMSFNITKPIVQDEETSNVFVRFWNWLWNE